MRYITFCLLKRCFTASTLFGTDCALCIDIRTVGPAVSAGVYRCFIDFMTVSRIRRFNFYRSCCFPNSQLPMTVFFVCCCRALILNAPLNLLVIGLYALAGLIMYATYHDCDPKSIGLVSRSDQILPYYVIHKLSHLHGLPGLFVSAIYGAGLRLVGQM